MSGIYFTTGPVSPALLERMDQITHAWTMKAARGECPWVCADCCVTFPQGMPDACAHGHQACTDIITRDKLNAASPQAEKEGE
jgi:hypothetical protein